MQASQPPPDVTTSSGYMAGRSIDEDEDEDEIEGMLFLVRLKKPTIDIFKQLRYPRL